MLRMAHSTENGTMRIQLEGNLAGAWVDECRAELARRSLPGRRVLLDVTELRFVDARGTEFLRELSRRGALCGRSSYVVELLKSEGIPMDPLTPVASSRFPSSNPHGAPSATPANSALLCARLRDGDETAREELVRAHAGALLEVARKFCRRESQALEALQDAFDAAFRMQSRVDSDSQVRAWLRQLVVDACLARRDGRTLEDDGEDAEARPSFTERGHFAQAIEPWPDTPRVSCGALRARVRESIDQLPDTQRIVLLLADAEELGVDAIGERLGLPALVVRERLLRARQALRAQLEPCFTAPEPATAGVPA